MSPSVIGGIPCKRLQGMFLLQELKPGLDFIVSEKLTIWRGTIISFHKGDDFSIDVQRKQELRDNEWQNTPGRMSYAPKFFGQYSIYKEL